MDVYLVPVGGGRHELYYEAGGDRGPARHPPSSGWRRKLLDVFAAVLTTVEREHERAAAAPPAAVSHAGLLARQRARLVRWLAERIAEQRLLWRLPATGRVRAFYPAGLDETAAAESIRARMIAEVGHHRLWMVIDTGCLLFALLLTPLPGPNVPGYYFTFQVVGHALAWRGARRGLHRVEWALEASAPLAALADLDRLAPAGRPARVREVAAALGLRRLARFVERTAPETP